MSKEGEAKVRKMLNGFPPPTEETRDTERLNFVYLHEVELRCNEAEGEWRVVDAGVVLARSPSLRAAIDKAMDYERVQARLDELPLPTGDNWR